MKEKNYQFSFEEYNDISELNADDADLLSTARNATKNAYAPYSNFNVAAVALLSNNEIITATNQENASFPAGICAERTLLSAIASVHPNTSIRTIAISYNNTKGKSDHPIAPCGICRQSLIEFENRLQQPIRLLLSGQTGRIIIIKNAGWLLPLSFSGNDFF